ncbi:MAG: U32 family peptidase [Lentisphaeria bacterium]|nr:U32 family peptidase [Lentisphaeria bacterium]
MTVSTSRIPELLAPAGNLNTALAAFDAGADAVYAGLKKFNARERGDNFTPEEMGQLIAYAHRNGKKVYLTFNTLLRDSELEEDAESLAELHYLRPDALIVQDIGAAAVIRDFFPGMEIHASTQMAIHNSAGIRTAAEMGCSRVILERAATLDELRQMTKNSPVELEVFIHGALCCSLSGICLLSSRISHGDASGNRGKCKQPCRMLYKDATGKDGFFLSTRDLCGLDLVPEFIRMGVSSLKIEGRLRKADYVAGVVKAYRMVLDRPEDPEVRKEAYRILDRTCSRERSHGYYTKESANSLIRSDAPGGIGQIRGRVIRAGKTSFEAELSASLHVGDNIRVQSVNGDDAQAFTILELSTSSGKVKQAPAGCRCTIGTPKRNIAPGGIIYRIGYTHDTMEKRIGNLPVFKPAVDFSLSLDGKQLSASAGEKVFRMELSLSPSEKHPVSEAVLKEAFETIGTLSFVPSVKRIELSGEWFLPSSLLKELRRNFREWACTNISVEEIRKESERCAETFLEHARGMKYGGSKSVYQGGIELPFFTSELEWHALEKEVEKSICSGEKVFCAANLSHFQLKKKYPEMILKTIPPFPVSNRIAAEESARLGAAMVHAHVELPDDERVSLKQGSPIPVEEYHGNPVLLATRAAVKAKGSLKTVQGLRFRIEKRGEFTCILEDI